MKVLAWNVAHKASERTRLKPRLVEAVQQMHDVDVVVLNEYVHGPSRKPLADALSANGFAHVAVSENIGGNNQILIASKVELKHGELRGPATVCGGGQSNFLHVQLPTTDLEIVGLRVPAWPLTSTLRDYWSRLETTIRSMSERRIVFLGDFNAGPDTKHVGSRHLASLREDGWSIPEAGGLWSFVSGKRKARIDHAILSKNLQARQAHYLTRLGEFDVGSSIATPAISDHFPLLVEVGDALVFPRSTTLLKRTDFH